MASSRYVYAPCHISLNMVFHTFYGIIWACEFVEMVPEPGFEKESLPLESERVIKQIGYVIDNTTKTRAIFEINKGTNKVPQIKVNDSIAHEDRRIPFENMVCIADGPSDIPMFSLVKHFSGSTYAVYKSKDDNHFNQANGLLKQNRVHAFGEADYSEGSHTNMWITKTVEDIARRIAKKRAKWLENNIGTAPKHLTE